MPIHRGQSNGDSHLPRPMALLGAFLLVLTPSGCSPSDTTSSNDGADTGDAPGPQAPTWTETTDQTGHTLRGPMDGELDQAMVVAINEARATAPQAREQWLSANLGERDNWLIKWEASIEPGTDTDSGGEPTVEFLWVRPIEWSPFRIEGVLLSPPVGDLAVTLGDLVAFPIEQLADWVYKVEGTMKGPRQGGFTVSLLEKRFGSPSQETGEPDQP